MKSFKTGVLLLILVLVMLPSAMAQTKADAPAGHPGVPYPSRSTPKAIDLGSLAAQPGKSTVSVTLTLSLPKLSEAENLLASISTPGHPQYRRFLTADEFVARFAPTNADVAKVITQLAKYGLSVQRTTATTLKVTGTPADLERAFSVSL